MAASIKFNVSILKNNIQTRIIKACTYPILHKSLGFTSLKVYYREMLPII